MSRVFLIVIVLAVIFYFLSIFSKLRQKTLELRYAMFWIVSGIVVVILIVLPLLFRWELSAAGKVEWINNILSLLIVCVFIIFLSITAIISKLYSNFRSLIQKISIYEKRIRDLEEKISEIESRGKDE